MNKLIKISQNEKNQSVVSAKELYLFLGMDKSNWSSWSKKNIESNDFAIENQDWGGFVVSTNGNETKDFALSLDFAKRLAMMSRTERGEEVRNYFIECEKQLAIPKEFTVKELLTMQLEMLNRLEESEKTVHILTHVNKNFTTTEIAKELNFKSAKELNKKLHDLGIQFLQNETWVLYSKYSGLAYVDIKQEVLDSGKIVYHRKWTGIGREFLIKLFTQNK